MENLPKRMNVKQDICSPCKKFQNLINVGPTFIPDYRVQNLTSTKKQDHFGGYILKVAVSQLLKSPE